jgi:hypothetical protein
MTLSIKTPWVEWHYAECRDLNIVMLDVVVLSVVMLNVVAPKIWNHEVMCIPMLKLFHSFGYPSIEGGIVFNVKRANLLQYIEHYASIEDVYYRALIIDI